MSFKQDIQNIQSTAEDLKKFGFVVGGAFVLLGLFIWWRGHVAVPPYLFGIGFSLLISGVLIPQVLKPFQKVWMTFAVMLGWIVTRVLLVIVFFLMVTPIGILARLFGKKFLFLSHHADAASYWEKRENTLVGKKSMEQQF